MKYQDCVFIRNNLVKKQYYNKFGVKFKKLMFSSLDHMYIGLDENNNRYKFRLVNNQIRRILK